MLKESRVKYNSSLLYLFITLMLFVIVKDQFAFDTASRKQFILLTENFAEYQQRMKEEMGIAVVEISGEEIYNGRCIACHQYEQRLVGPPYKDVLPKYEGKTEELVQFILNPVKVDADYPAMPNQGLKPKEAEAVAEYLVKTYMQ
jgi:cytochrome c